MKKTIKKELSRKHIETQFLSLLLSILVFLIFAVFVGNISWFNGFENIIVLLSGIFAVFTGIIALLRYSTQRVSPKFLFLGVGFIAIGLIDLLSLASSVGIVGNIFIDTWEFYPIQSVLSKGAISLLIFLSWFLSEKDRSGKKKELFIISFVVILTIAFISGVLVFNDMKIFNEYLVSMVVGIVSLVFLLLSLLGYLFRGDWKFEDIDFWLIFGISFFLISQVFYLPLLNLEYDNMINLSVLAQFFGYLALLIGFLNSINDLYKKNLSIQRELESKNKELDNAKKKIEEAYLVIRQEKWDLVGKKRDIVTKKK